MKFDFAPELESDIKRIAVSLGFDHLVIENIHCFRSYGSTSRAIARIWSLPRIWQMGLNTPPAYCLEVISEHFDRLDEVNKDKVLIHELLHIPKNFSGALLPHKQRTKRIDRRTVDRWHDLLRFNRK